MTSSFSSRITLNRYNYPEWVKYINQVLELGGLKVWITDQAPKLETATSPFESYKLSQGQIRTAGLNKSQCSEDIALEIANLNDPKFIWDTLKKLLQHSSRSYSSCCLK